MKLERLQKKEEERVKQISEEQMLSLEDATNAVKNEFKPEVEMLGKMKDSIRDIDYNIENTANEENKFSYLSSKLAKEAEKLSAINPSDILNTFAVIPKLEEQKEKEKPAESTETEGGASATGEGGNAAAENGVGGSNAAGGG